MDSGGLFLRGLQDIAIVPEFHDQLGRTVITHTAMAARPASIVPRPRLTHPTIIPMLPVCSSESAKADFAPLLLRVDSPAHKERF